MADYQARYRLLFEADASKAKKEINDLVTKLREIQAQPFGTTNMKSMENAIKAAYELEKHLKKATNVDTGRLDLSRFTASVNSSNRSVDGLLKNFNLATDSGRQAFTSLANNINNAEASTLRLNRGMREFLTTLKNTAKWQLSSSIMHGLMSTISDAYGYAQRLDKSLNDIRIVSGASADEMARFAVEANKSAQALSTTTRRYADASLLYFQQGEVKFTFVEGKNFFVE